MGMINAEDRRMFGGSGTAVAPGPDDIDDR
jgi:hypothetical protein